MEKTDTSWKSDILPVKEFPEISGLSYWDQITVVDGTPPPWISPAALSSHKLRSSDGWILTKF